MLDQNTEYTDTELDDNTVIDTENLKNKADKNITAEI